MSSLVRVDPMAGLLNSDVAQELFLKELNSSLVAAAEPILQESLKKIEAEMRRKMAENCAAVASNYIEMRTMHDILEIRVRRPVEGSPF
jgi:hypothetical protein